MIQTLNEKTWLKTLLILVALIGGIALWLYIAGGIFLVANGKRFTDSTPITIYQYWFYYRKNAHVVKEINIIAGISLALILIPFARFFTPMKESLFGTARYATNAEIKKAGLFGEIGIIVGQIGKRFLIFGGQQHVVVSAPTRGWKGISVVITNLLNWGGSSVTSDMKGENHDITSGYRSRRGQKCYFFNPTARDYRTHRWNPLFYISDDPNFRIDDIMKIGSKLFPDVQGTDPIWTATPRSLFLGIVLFLAETPGKLVTIGQVRRESLMDGDGSEYFNAIIAERAANGNPLSASCVQALNSYTSIASDNTRSGIMTSFRSRLELWSNPFIDAATSANDFDWRDLRKTRMSIYYGITPDNLERMLPLTNLFFQQGMDLNIQELPSKNKKLKYTVLWVLDEFTALGKLDVFTKGVSFIAGYGHRLLTIIQSPSQPVDVYGEAVAENFTTNHAAQIVFAPKRTEIKLAQQISEWLGYKTVKGLSESRGKGLFKKKSASESESDQKRALVLPQEVTSLGQENEIVIIEHCEPIRAKKAVYYRSHVFIDRLKSVSPSLAALGRRLPKQKEIEAATEAGELRAPVPKLDMEAHSLTISSEANTYIPRKKKSPGAAKKSGGTQIQIVERAATAEDEPNLKLLALADFAIDFSAVKQPELGDLDEVALMAYADELCAAANVEPATDSIQI